VVPGFVGAYPNAFWRVTDTELPAFVKQFAAVRNARDYRALARRYAIARDDDRFWSHSDWMHRSYRAQDPVGWGLFEYCFIGPFDRYGIDLYEVKDGRIALKDSYMKAE